MGIVAVTWSTRGVTYVDPTGRVLTALNLKDLAAAAGIKPNVILVAHRNSLIRTIKVPNLSKSQLEPLIRAKTTSLFPSGTQGYSFGYRVVSDPSEAGKLAILGGTKLDTLRQINKQAAELGIKNFTVFPTAFASWIAACEKGIRDVVVVSQLGDDTCFDVISKGELVYSRFTQLESPSDLEAEVSSTLRTAGYGDMPTLTLGFGNDPRGPASFITDPASLRNLFSLELPEVRERREKKKTFAAAQRGVALTAIAAICWGFAIWSHQSKAEDAAHQANILLAINRGESQKLANAQLESARLKQSAHLLNVAFDPSQTFHDMVTVLSQDSNPKIWLTGLSMLRGGAISIRGEAQDHKSITEYLKKLRAEPRFRAVQLKFSTKGKRANQDVVQFAIGAWGIGNLPFDQHIEEPKN